MRRRGSARRVAIGGALFAALGLTLAVAAAPVLQPVEVQVPTQDRSPPFDRSRTLQVPSGYGVRVLARVPDARFLLVLPDGGVLASQPSAGAIALLRPQADGRMTVGSFASGLRRPHDMVLADVDGRRWLYVAESHRVSRAPWQPGDRQLGELQPVVTDLPDDSTPELHGHYGHALKNIAVSPGGVLYVSIASSCNACESDVLATPVRGAIYRYDADGGRGRLFARGIRNAEGLAIMPGTEQLWIAVNNRDQIAYPGHDDIDGDGQDDHGRIVPRYVDEQPPEPFTDVRDGADYGWPYCNPVAGGDMRLPALVADVQFNGDGRKLDCARAGPIAYGLHAHSAPLGFSFLQGAGLPAPLSQGAVVALHGCWNCTRPFGYKLVQVRFDAGGRPLDDRDLVTGFATQDGEHSVWGRPVDAVPDPGRRSLLISDDASGTVYELFPRPRPPQVRAGSRAPSSSATAATSR